MRRLVVLAWLLLAVPVHAHPLAPALLELRELGEGRVAVTWKTSRYRATGSDVAPQLPDACVGVAAPQTSGDADSLTSTWEVRCAGGLVGARLGVTGLGAAGIDALIRVTLADGRVVRGVVRAAAPEFIVPAREARLAIARAYVAIGIEHILTGFDHLLFVAGLMLLVRGRRLLIETITAFTVGHSITLSLAALDLLRVPTRPVELLIAASVFVLAVELTRPADAPPSLLRRRPWLLALAFGLLHGLGFAGALRDVGLPSGDVPLALLSFNLGIEIGQLAVIAALLAGAAALARLPLRWPAWAPLAPVYVIGSLAAYWCLERAAALIR
jgi:hydrogenase/urease accessory protein HupE